MVSVGIRELKNRLSHYIEQAKDGETVVVTDRGVPVAKIERLGGEKLPAKLEKMIAEGQIIPGVGSFRDLPEPHKMLPGKKTFADYVSEQRD